MYQNVLIALQARIRISLSTAMHQSSLSLHIMKVILLKQPSAQILILKTNKVNGGLDTSLPPHRPLPYFGNVLVE